VVEGEAGEGFRADRLGGRVGPEAGEVAEEGQGPERHDEEGELGPADQDAVGQGPDEQAEGEGQRDRDHPGLDESLAQDPIDAVLPGAEEIIPLGFIPDSRDHASPFVLLGSRERARAITGSFIWSDSGFAVRGVGAAVGGEDLDPDLL